MTRARGRPAAGHGVARDDIVTAALALMDNAEGRSVTMRALAAHLGVTPMTLYHHVGDLAGLLRVLAERVYGAVLQADGEADDPAGQVRALLVRYHDAVGRHPQLTLAIFATPDAFSGVTRDITDRLAAGVSRLTAQPAVWTDVLVDHAHGSGLALAAARGDAARVRTLREQYRQALDALLVHLAPPAASAATRHRSRQNPV